MSLQPKPTLSFDEWLEGERASLEGRWTLSDYATLTDRVPLASVDCTLALTEVYDKLAVADV